MKTLPLTQGKITFVDDDVYDWASKFKWQAMRAGRGYYVGRRTSQKLGKRRTLLLHREILGLKFGDPREGHHIDGDGLDNRRANLRICTCQQNGHGFQRKRADVTSKFRGVSWYRRSQNWYAHIKLNGYQRHLGAFEVEEDAARAYDRAAKEFFGEFACPNFP